VLAWPPAMGAPRALQLQRAWMHPMPLSEYSNLRDVAGRPAQEPSVEPREEQLVS